MKILTFIILLFFPLAVLSQDYASDRLFEKYAGKEGFTTVYISEYMFSLFSNIESDNDDFNKTIKGLQSIKILSTENKTANKDLDFYKELSKSLPKHDYKELMVIKEKQQETKFLIKETRNGSIGELLLISGGDENTLISIKGSIDLKTISNLSKSMKIQGMENLENLNDNTDSEKSEETE